LRDQREAGRFLKIKKPPDFANEEWRKFGEPAQKQFERTGLILLFAEKRPDTLGADECNQTGILTSASNLTPAFPTFISGIGNL
jgi:hypothetical protein